MSEHNSIESAAEYGTDKKTLKAYLIGFALCLILTFVPFGLVAKQLLQPQYLYVVLMLFALIQLYVQVVFFLRLDTNPKARWNLVSFVFAVLVILILVIGTLWIMYNLNYNMMN